MKLSSRLSVVSRLFVIGGVTASLSATGLTALPGLASTAAGSPAASGPQPVPKGTPQPDPRPVSQTDAASKWPMPVVTFPAPGSVTVPVSSTALAHAGVVTVAAPAALGTLGLPATPSVSASPKGMLPPRGVPVWNADTTVPAPGAVQIATLGDAARQQLGDAPMVFTVDRADAGSGNAPVALSVDYSGFRDAYGGSYAERLEIVRYPACVLTTPEVPDCSVGTPVAGQVNDPYATTLTAVVDADGPVPAAPLSSSSPSATPSGAGQAPVAAGPAQPAVALPVPTDSPSSSPTSSPSPTDSSAPGPSPSPTPTDSGAGTPSGSVFAVTSSPSGPSGTYIASPLLPSSHWAVGLQSGSFQYSYPITTPVPPGGPQPDVSLDYDSGSVDGRTSVTNPQASWAGMGWDYEPGFIEREYASCNSLGTGHTNSDLCYTTSPINVTLNLGGMTTHLIQDTDGTWRLQDDPGWLVTDGSGASGSPDATGEYWKLQAPDGTTYYFGRGVGVSGTGATNSTWTVPVFGYPGSTCSPGGVFTSCAKGWRWNLDYVLRTNGNETTYTYAQETNAYNVNGVALAKSYVRGGHVSTITYGLRDGDTSTPVDKVVFTAAVRCVQNMNGASGACPTLGPANATSYPDVPTDLVCVTNSTMCKQSSPSFWTTSMLTNVDTYTLTTGGSQSHLDGYAMQYQLPDPDGGGPESPALWLSQVQHTGYLGGTVTLPPLYTFGTAMPNRFLDPGTGVSPVDMYRVADIENETGGYLEVNYFQQDPCSDAVEAADHSRNQSDCYPVWFVPSGSSQWGVGWFNKYLVSRVGQYVNYLGESPHSSIRTVTSEPIVTDYKYQGGAAWHKDDFEVNPTINDSWNVYRGYATVSVFEDQVSGTVIGSGYESVTVHQMYRGMYGDLYNDGTTNTSTVSTTTWGAANDYNWLAGRDAEVLTETGGSTVLSTVDTNYWAALTAQTTTTTPTEVAKEVAPYMTMTLTPNHDGTTRRHEVVDVHYDASSTRSISNGAVIAHADLGNVDITDNGASCTSIGYVANTSAYLLEPEIRNTYAGVWSSGACPTTGALLGSTEMFWDNTSDSSLPPTNGNLDRVKTELTTAPTYANTYAGYDQYGRVQSTTDGNGNVTTTAYTPSTGRPDSVSVTGPVVADLGASLTTSTTLTLRGQPAVTTDANNKSSEQDYDALGRLTAAYAPTEYAGGTKTHQTFTATYNVNQAGWSTVETRNLLTSGGAYRDTWTYLDGWLRAREVHTTSYGGTGHLTVQTRFNDIGEVAAASSPYVRPGAINAGADYTPPASVPLEIDSGYDAMHRVTSQARTASGAQSWGRTTTAYYGDEIDTTPPVPAPATSTTIDAWGRPRVSTETSQTGDGLHSQTVDAYDPLGRLGTVVDDAGKTNYYYYDLAGRRIRSVDADAGTSTTTYDANGNPTVVTDALGVTLTTTYDVLNRPMSVTSGGTVSAPSLGAELIDYTYDTAGNGRGRPLAVTVHDVANGTTAWTSTVGGYDENGRVLSTTYTLPPVSGLASAISYQTSQTYNPDGQPATMIYGALGDQPSDTVSYSYDNAGTNTGLPLSMSGPFNATANYSNLDQLTNRTYGDSTSAGYMTRAYGYTDPLERLSDVTTTVTHNAVPVVQHDAFTYDNLDEPYTVTGSAPADNGQVTCFRYDGLDRLATAWTETSNCNNWAATTADGPYGFNQQFTYTSNGLPSTVVNSGSSSSYAASDSNHPHAITAFGGNSYSYDANGQELTRTVGGASTTLSWDPLHHLYTSVTGAATTKYVNGPDGSRIARLDSDGSTTIWVAGNEVHVANGVATATRYFTLAGATIAQRNSSGLTWLASDGQNSRDIAVNASTGAATRTYYLPYGAVRTGAPSLPTDQNFLGRVLDSSGLLQDGARYYDPSMGQFISPDPLANTSNNSTLDPYGYAADNPVAGVDASGLINQPVGSSTDVTGGPYAFPTAQTVQTVDGPATQSAVDARAIYENTSIYDYSPDLARAMAGQIFSGGRLGAIMQDYDLYPVYEHLQLEIAAILGFLTLSAISLPANFVPGAGAAEDVGLDAVVAEEDGAIGGVGGTALTDVAGSAEAVDAPAGVDTAADLPNDSAAFAQAGSGAAEAGSGAGRAALDSNVLIRGLDNGELSGVDKALAGRAPIISPTAAGEYLVKGDQGALDEFLSSRGGGIGLGGTQEGAEALQAQASGLGRALGYNDALIAHSAMQEGIPLITGDQQLLRFLGEIGYPAEGF